MEFFTARRPKARMGRANAARRGEARVPTLRRAATLAAVTFLEAAELILRQAKRPLTTREITELALRRGLLKTRGKTPEATMSAALYGATTERPIRREYNQGRIRAVRGSVRWVYVRSET